MKTSLTLAVAAALGFASFASATVYTGPGGPLVDGTATDTGVALFDIPVADAGTVVSVNSVTLTGMTHTWLGDLVGAVVAPDGTSFAVIFSPRDGESANLNGNYTFVVDPTLPTLDEVSNPLGTNDNVPSGTYAIADYGGGTANGPRTNFDAFVGVGLAGTWTLEIDDFGIGDTGALTSWSLDITSAPVPEPTSLAVLSLGSLVLRRRRA